MTKRTAIRLHLTNVKGAGATELLLSLIPAIELDTRIWVSSLYLPNSGRLHSYQPSFSFTYTEIYTRKILNSFSRFFECTLLAWRFNGDSPLLVFGDIPLSCKAPQVVFVQTPNLIQADRADFSLNFLKYLVSRIIFRLNLKKVKAFIVQTSVMRDALEISYPAVKGRVHVIGQPVPEWLLENGLKRSAVSSGLAGRNLRLIYPAANYPHKNHDLLAKIELGDCWPIEQLILTLDSKLNPVSAIPWIHCSGFLSAQGIIDAYSNVDALVFLSKKESYGFPLVEAMIVGLPIVCPDLPYARILCGDEAIYFNPDSAESLKKALEDLKNRLHSGWWPNWEHQLRSIPSDWGVVAKKIVDVLLEA